MAPLVVIFMIQFCLIVDNETPGKTQEEEKIDCIYEKRFPGLGSLCPFQFPSCVMPFLSASRKASICRLVSAGGHQTAPKSMTG